MEKKPILKGYRTYIAILLTGIIGALGGLHVIDQDTSSAIVGILTAFGLYYRYQSDK